MARVERTGGNLVLASGAPLTIPFEVEAYDFGNMWVIGSPTQLTAPVHGIYSIKASVWISGLVARSTLTNISARLNGVTEIANANLEQTGAGGDFANGAALTLAFDYELDPGTS